MSSKEAELNEDFFDASKMSQSSLRKYQSYFKIECSDEELRDKVKYHFDNEFKIEPNVVLQRFLKLKRDQKDNPRKSNRPKGKPLV